MLINGNEHNDLCVGIDLGTTNSVLAVVNKKPNGDLISKVVPLNRAVGAYAVQGGSKYSREKKPLLPSYVYYQPESGFTSLVGDYAKSMYAKRPHLVAKSIKSKMGETDVTGLSADIPDQTPAEVSARILKHLLEEANKTYRTNITDAVITVPANFDAAMCKATLEAAKLAGLSVKNIDGTEKPVLLSEPNAVIYDLINQIHNGEVPGSVIDLSAFRNVMVFDIGGGTLDITMHRIGWQDEHKSILKVDEIATNRYTLLGGDDFDEVIAEAMFERYLQKYSDTPQLVEEFRKDKDSIMAQMRIYAEGLKIDVSDEKQQFEDDNNGWGWDEDHAVGGYIGSTGYSYDDVFTNEEVEGYLNTFMGQNLQFSDYKRLNSIKDTRNIIYPILDVLQKASQKLNVDDVQVDALVLNGGMSKHYMVQNRLTEFFGFEPIVVLDPDQAVARGASVYHYYLHLNEALLKKDMRLVGDDVEFAEKRVPKCQPGKYSEPKAALYKESKQNMHIAFGNTILNDSLYLGLKNGAQPVELISTGQELPYISPVMHGFQINAEQTRICIPIQSRNIDGSMRTIVKGNIMLRRKMDHAAYVSFNVSMSPSKVLTMNAWISHDLAGKQISEEATVEIVIGREAASDQFDMKLAPPSGSTLVPNNEINVLLQLCKNFDSASVRHNTLRARQIAEKLRSLQECIYRCANKADFAVVILDELKYNHSYNTAMRLYTIARKLCDSWTPSQKTQLARACMNEIQVEIQGLYSTHGEQVSAITQAINTLGKCGTVE